MKAVVRRQVHIARAVAGEPAHSAFWIASEPDAAHNTCSNRPPPGLSRKVSIVAPRFDFQAVTALYAVMGSAEKYPAGVGGSNPCTHGTLHPRRGIVAEVRH